MLEYGLSLAKNVKSSWRFVASSTGHVWGSASPHLDLVWLLITVSHSLSVADTPSLLHSNVILLAGCWHWHWISNVFVDILYYCLNHIWCLSCPTRTLWYTFRSAKKIQSLSIVMRLSQYTVQFSAMLAVVLIKVTAELQGTMRRKSLFLWLDSAPPPTLALWRSCGRLGEGCPALSLVWWRWGGNLE